MRTNFGDRHNRIVKKNIYIYCRKKTFFGNWLPWTKIYTIGKENIYKLIMELDLVHMEL